MVDWAKVTWEDMLKAIPKLAKDLEGKYTFDVTVFDAPTNGDVAAGFFRCVHRVVHQVDQQLVELVAVRKDL